MAKDALQGKTLGGTNVKESAFAKKQILFHHFQPRMQYAWDNGVAIGAYLEGLKAGKIIAARCESCNRTLLPARAFCELCFRPTDGWVEVADTGTVQTFSISWIHYDASRLKPGEKPYLPAVIAIDGAGEKMGIMHMLGEVEPSDITIGMKVEAVWKPAEEREGSITDIRYFRPVAKAKKPAAATTKRPARAKK